MRKSSAIMFFTIFLLIIALESNCLIQASSPQWRNQKQDAPAILRGEYESLQAEGWGTALHEAVLSTNETGEWKNETASPVLWMQPDVHGFDNFGTATYKDGVLYAPSKGNDNLYALNATNGDILWNRTVRQCDGSPCIDGDVIYAGECSGPNGEHTPNPRAIALNATNGEEIWHFVEPDDYAWVGSPVVKDDYVYCTTYGSGIYALNKTNGKPIWHQGIGIIVCSAAYDDGAVFVSAYSPPGQYAFNATTGGLLWHRIYGKSWDSSPIVYDEIIIQVIRSNSSNVWTTYVLNETTGEIIRTFENKGSTATPLVHDDGIFIPSNDRKIWAFNLLTGQELWCTLELHDGTLQDYSYCSPAGAGGAIYFQALNGTFYMLNETDGDILWSHPLSGYGFGSPSIGDGKVFITNDDGLYAFSIGPGSGNWPMFCQNSFHRSSNEQGIEYVRWPLTQPKYLGDLSSTWLTAEFIWCNQTISSGSVAWRIFFFDNMGNTNVTDEKTFRVNMPIHDVAVKSIVPSEMLIEQNQTVWINVTVSNEGNYLETFNVTLYYDSTMIGLQTLTLDAGELQILTFEWNSTGVSDANHTLSACASPVSQEADLQDNTYTMEYPVTVTPEFRSLLALAAALTSTTTITMATIVKRRRSEDEAQTFDA